MQVRTAVRLGGVVTVAGLLWVATPALADEHGAHRGGWSQQSQQSRHPSSTAGSPGYAAGGDGSAPSSQDASPTAANGPTADPQTAAATVARTAAAQPDGSTCPDDSGLPAPVLGTALTTLGTVETTVEGTSGALPVDPAGTVGSAAGCSSSGPTPSPSGSPTATPTPEPTDGATTATASPSPSATDASAPSTISASLPEATPAQAVRSHVSFAG